MTSMIVPIAVTLVGRLTDVRDVHDRKTPTPNGSRDRLMMLTMMMIMMILVVLLMLPILITLAGIVTVVSD